MGYKIKTQALSFFGLGGPTHELHPILTTLTNMYLILIAFALASNPNTVSSFIYNLTCIYSPERPTKDPQNTWISFESSRSFLKVL